MSIDLFSFKELYDVYLKLTYPIEVGNKKYEAKETIAKFDKIQVAGLQEFKDVVTANGGFDNRAWVFWETTKELRLSFSQGVFSKTHFALLANSRMLELQQGKELLLTKTENKESDGEGKISLEHAPIQDIFVYKKENGEKILNFELKDNIVIIPDIYTDCVVEYKYSYDNGAQVVKVGRRLINGFLEFEGKTRVKDDVTGQVVTGLIKIPKLKLMSDLSMRLGSQANPVVANFSAIGVPVGTRGTSHVSEFYFLNNDVDSDM